MIDFEIEYDRQRQLVLLMIKHRNGAAAAYVNNTTSVSFKSMIKL